MQVIKELIAAHWMPIHPRLRTGILVVVGGLVAVVVALASLPSGSQSPSDSTFDSSQSWTPESVASAEPVLQPSPVLDAPLLVHVVGQVVSPGVYQLDPGARVVDAVAAAQGFTAKAAQESVNLARPVNDGEQIVILAKGQTAVAEFGGSGVPAKISLNAATAQQLEALPGIGPALAARIVDYRNSHGSFRALADLAKVSGLGPKLIAGIKDLVTL